MSQRKTRGTTFDIDKPEEQAAYDFSFKINLSDWTRKNVLMIKAVKEQRPDLFHLFEQVNLADFMLRYLPNEKQRLELRERMLNQLESTQVNSSYIEYNAIGQTKTPL